jgi:hypothetical protein
VARKNEDDGEDTPRVTPKKAKNAISVAKVVGPAVIPVVAPYALKAAGEARDRFDRFRARRLGVDVEDIAKYSGRGGGLQARIAGDLRGCGELTERDGHSEADAQFATSSSERLQALTAAVRAAERMPYSRRRAAFQSIDADLDVLEKELLERLGVRQA